MSNRSAKKAKYRESLEPYDPAEYMSDAEARVAIGYSRQSLWNLRRAGKLSDCKHGRDRVYRRAEVTELINKRDGVVVRSLEA